MVLLWKDRKEREGLRKAEVLLFCFSTFFLSKNEKHSHSRCWVETENFHHLIQFLSLNNLFHSNTAATKNSFKWFPNKNLIIYHLFFKKSTHFLKLLLSSSSLSFQECKILASSSLWITFKCHKMLDGDKTVSLVKSGASKCKDASRARSQSLALLRLTKDFRQQNNSC